MSFRIEEKLYIRPEHILDFKEFLTKHSAKQLYKPREINLPGHHLKNILPC